MDFFEAQARAKKHTTRLVVLFVLAVLGIITAGYFATVTLLGQVNGRVNPHDSYPEAYDQVAQSGSWWQPQILATVTLITVAVVGLASLYKWFQLRAGGTAIAEMVGGTVIDPRTTDPKQRQLLNIVEEMSIASGLPMPAVYVLPDEQGINAFAAGLTTSDAVVAVTRGTLEKLNRDELQGVVAHEFSHILNGDMRLNVKLTAIVFGILVIGLIGRGVLAGLARGRVRSSGNGKNSGGGLAFVIAVGVVMMALGYIGYFFGRLIQAAVSRQREFLADASAVQFTRNPSGITGALKKIGGYALGSNLQSTKSEQIGHFFFAQGFRSMLGGAWATHPPLDVRIRAIDASFDGRYFEPPTVVDVTRQTWSDQRSATRPASAQKTARPAINPVTLIASIGALDATHTSRAQTLADNIPSLLRDAVRIPSGAAALVCGLLLDDKDEAVRTRQHELIRRHAGEEIATALTPLEADLRTLPHAVRLPLLLLTPPALRQLSPAGLAGFIEALDELVHADGQVSLFEFALQKVLTHHLDLAAHPSGSRESYSPSDVSPEISVVLSFGARLRAADENETALAFSAGASGFSGLHPPLALRIATLDDLDAALNKLALAYGPVKKRLLTALAATVSSDGQVDPEEAELLRALASTLDCPMPLAI
ncbi:M48 family metallopeptidase [Rariglobus hedericola]|uniref:M48 family metallopeptidase n=1 Tax=Rariglobus hedericola TaxID=2597822 RepID=A0A556QKS4_9BACT|nr:M48 family metallopeptidase [Rariglobus hedericola]TSJ77221.1 M48 family metallopeptidase [Rariglobus hedericola]